MVSMIFLGLPFVKSFYRGWWAYYSKSSGPKFTEEQVRLTDEAVWAVKTCEPVEEFLDPITYYFVCQ